MNYELTNDLNRLEQQREERARNAKVHQMANFTFSTGWMDDVPGEKGDIADWVLATRCVG